MPDNSIANLGAAFQRALPAGTRTRIARWAPWALFVGLLILAAWLAARLTWQFIPSGSGSEDIVAMSAPAASRPAGPGPAEQIAAAHLFGIAAPTSQGSGENAPETSLNLNLIGVAAGTRGAPSQAIIASGSNNDETTYAVGANLPGGAIIRQILPDRVILAHDGRLETLRLPVSGTSILAAGMSFDGQGGGGSSLLDEMNAAAPGEVQTSASGGPGGAQNLPLTAAGQFLRLTPYVQQGHIEGYTVYPGSNPELFEQSGLQPGDVVVSVNGAKLDNPGLSMQAMAQLRSAQGPVHLVVLRKGQQMNITINPGG